MTMQSWSGRSLALRLGGGLLLLAAWRIAQASVALGRGDAGHEPVTVYALCLLAFLCASAGAALVFNGARLFGKVPTGELWTPRRDDEMASYQSRPHRPRTSGRRE